MKGPLLLATAESVCPRVSLTFWVHTLSPLTCASLLTPFMGQAMHTDDERDHSRSPRSSHCFDYTTDPHLGSSGVRTPILRPLEPELTLISQRSLLFRYFLFGTAIRLLLLGWTRPSWHIGPVERSTPVIAKLDAITF